MASQREILFYNNRSRAGATAHIGDDGVVRHLHQIPADDLELWTHLVSDGRFILFYNDRTRDAATARIGDDGVLGDQQAQTEVALGLWTHMVS